MSLDAGDLGDEIKAAIESSSVAVADASQLQDLCDAIASAVVAHFTTNAVVLPGTFEDSAGDPVTGQGVVT